MSTDRAEVAVEIAIAEHIINSFQPSSQDGKPDAIVAQVRNRITDNFHSVELQTEQDNQPPPLVAFYRRIAAAFAPIEKERDNTERSSRLTDIKGALEDLRGALPAAAPRSRLDHARSRLLIERQQLLVKNEFTEGFGRIEAWILSISFLTLILLDVVSILWALPILALSIARAWHLDRQCKLRLRKISEIDALIDRIEQAP